MVIEDWGRVLELDLDGPKNNRTRVLIYSQNEIIQPSKFFFFNDTATAEIYTLSLHDAHDLRRVSSRTGGFFVRPPSRPSSPDQQTAVTAAGADHIAKRIAMPKQIIGYLII